MKAVASSGFRCLIVHAPLVAPAVLLACFYVWTASGGWPFELAEPHDGHYDLLARALVKGQLHLTVEPRPELLERGQVLDLDGARNLCLEALELLVFGIDGLGRGGLHEQGHEDVGEDHHWSLLLPGSLAPGAESRHRVRAPPLTAHAGRNSSGSDVVDSVRKDANAPRRVVPPPVPLVRHALVGLRNRPRRR